MKMLKSTINFNRGVILFALFFVVLEKSFSQVGIMTEWKERKEIGMRNLDTDCLL